MSFNNCNCSSSCGTSTWSTICTALANIGQWLTNIYTVVNAGFNNMFSSATQVYVQETRQHVAGSGNRQMAEDGTPVQLSSNSYRKVVIRHPVANSEDATVAISANTFTMSPGDPDYELDFSNYRFADAPSVTVTAGVGETGALIVDTLAWSNV